MDNAVHPDDKTLLIPLAYCSKKVLETLAYFVFDAVDCNERFRFWRAPDIRYGGEFVSLIFQWCCEKLVFDGSRVCGSAMLVVAGDCMVLCIMKGT